MRAETRLANTVSCPFCHSEPGVGCFWIDRRGIRRSIRHKVRLDKAIQEQTARSAELKDVQ